VLITGAPDVPERPRLRTIRLPCTSVAPQAILEALVMQSLAGEVAGRRGVTIEEFVFHNTDTKIGPDAAAHG
jgi:hypothetical protein